MKGLSLLIILTLLSPSSVAGHGQDESSVGLSEEEISKFYTETKIVGEGEAPQRCSEAVLQRRASATPTLGVESSVGLGAALFIFIGVGVFAVGIAQAFQMARIFLLL